ncbi:MAG TPA: hypothetical protein VEZ16_06455 [Microvirga sp.]|nr:hypothetical protein [Microvirga sp.]
MLTEADLNSPAKLHYEAVGGAKEGKERDWSQAREFPSLREAVHFAMTEEAPAGQHAVIRAASGHVLEPSHLDEIWASVQGP